MEISWRRQRHREDPSERKEGRRANKIADSRRGEVASREHKLEQDVVLYAKFSAVELKLCEDIIREHERYWTLCVGSVKSCKDSFIRRLVVIDVIAWRLK